MQEGRADDDRPTREESTGTPVDGDAPVAPPPTLDHHHSGAATWGRSTPWSDEMNEMLRQLEARGDALRGRLVARARLCAAAGHGVAAAGFFGGLLGTFLAVGTSIPQGVIGLLSAVAAICSAVAHAGRSSPAAAAARAATRATEVSGLLIEVRCLLQVPARDRPANPVLVLGDFERRLGAMEAAACLASSSSGEGGGAAMSTAASFRPGGRLSYAAAAHHHQRAPPRRDVALAHTLV